MSSEKKQKHIAWLKHRDIRSFLTWFAALVPPESIPRLVKKSDGWDIGPADGGPAIWTHYQDGDKIHRYCPFGNEDGIEPIVVWRSFHGMRPDVLELAQEFRFYHNLYSDPARKRFIYIDRNGDESDAARYGEDFMEIRTDLLRRFCAVKQMALAVYVESFRYSCYTMAELGLSETRMKEAGDHYHFPLVVVPEDILFKKKFETCGLVIGGKKYVLPEPMSSDEESDEEHFQEFIIGTDPAGKPVRHTCDPEQLANYFGANPDAPHYLTSVFFRAEVLSKY